MPKERFDHTKIEKEAQKKWEAAHMHETDLSAPGDPYYLLFEFPYPSGDLHIGHWYAYALTDIYARYLRMKGKNVLFPIGFDAFGLPAENAAMRNGADPKEWTYANMKRMRAQIKSIGTTVDWSKEVVTCDPSYYKWTQWLFSKLYEHNLAERKEAAVKWCPKDATVLANEQVVDGACERCGTAVEEKKLTQWFFKITNYAERLLADLEPLPWREEIKEAQRAWIGKKEGIVIRHSVVDTDLTLESFSAYPAWLYADTFVVIAPEHPMVSVLAEGTEQEEAVKSFVKEMAKETAVERSAAKEKRGVFTGRFAMDPLRNEPMPIWVANFALMDFGTGVIRCSGHDERDVEFAQTYGIPLRKVVNTASDAFVDAHENKGVLEDSGPFTGRTISPELIEEMVSWFVREGYAEKRTSYRIRDWLVSRQRYWGCPIPIVYDPEGNPHLVPAEHLPWLLPEDADFRPTGKAPLASSKELHERVEKIFGKGWTPEYDTFDTFVDSSWYFLRYLDSKDEEKFSDPALMEKWLPVDRYSGGSEHTTMHLLYARFFQKALYDLALVPIPEPFNERFNRGIILGPDGAKMSKSKGNVINPDEFVGKYGADAVRMYLAFIGPYNEPGHYPWNLDGVEAMRRFLDRVYTLSTRLKDIPMSESLERALAKATKKVSEDTERFKFNTAISALMVLLKELEEEQEVSMLAYGNFLKLLAPFAPHLTEHLYVCTGGESVHESSWPEADESLLTTDTVTVIVQVNGKKRAELSLSPETPEDEAVTQALSLTAVVSALSGNAPDRVIYVPGKILNLVAQG